MNEKNELVRGNTEYTPIIEERRIGKIILYQVTERELYYLKKGDDGGVKLNIAISLITMSISLLTSLLTTSFTTFIHGWFCTGCITSALFGIVFLILYFKSKKEVNTLYEEIIKRKNE